MNIKYKIYWSEPWRIKPMPLSEAYKILDASQRIEAKVFLTASRSKAKSPCWWGGAADLGLLIQTADEKLVCVDLDPIAAKSLALTLLNHGGEAWERCFPTCAKP